MEKNQCDMNQFDSDSHLPPRKRLLAGFKKLNGSSSSSSPFVSSSSSTSNSNGSSSSASTNLLASRFNNEQNQSPEELVEAARSAAVLAVKAAKAARAKANEKALISAKAIDLAKKALEFVDSFPKEDIAELSVCNKNKLKKHVPVEYDEEAVLVRRVLTTYSDFEENGQRNKKRKKKKNKIVVEGGSSSIMTGSMNDIAGFVDSDSSFEGLESNRKTIKALMKEKAEEESDSLSKRRCRVKLKKLPLSISNSRNHKTVSPLPVAEPPEENGVIPGSSSRKCQDLKASGCVKLQNKASVRS